MNETKLKAFLLWANEAHTVKVRCAKKANVYSLYLDHYNKGSRQRLFLNICLSLSSDQKTQDDQKLKLALSIRDKKEQVIISGGSLMDVLQDTDIDLLDYATEVLADKKPKNRSLYLLSVKCFLKHYPNSTLKSITLTQANHFRRSLADLSNVTQRHYIRSLSYIMAHAVKQSIITTNPFADIKIKLAKSEKHYLTITEIKMLIDTDTPYQEVKKAFIFSCFTGLRIGDITKLDNSNINDGHLVWQQSKTGSFENIKLSDIALQQINQERTGKLFMLPAYKALRRQLKDIITTAGITKPITFHCARHTFATMCLTLDIDIYTVSKLLGHSDVRVTQIYAKLIDQKKDMAITTLNKSWQ